MGKKKNPFVHQLKTLTDIGDRIQALIDKHRDLSSNRLGVMFRTVTAPNAATLYEEGHHGRGGLRQGIRECDYKFSSADPLWIEPSKEHGLSFSATMKHAVGTMEFLGKFQKKGTQVTCAYWILEDNQLIPEGLEFVQDPENADHYLLAVTRRMTVTELVFKLRWISQRMAVMTDLSLEAYKDA